MVRVAVTMAALLLVGLTGCGGGEAEKPSTRPTPKAGFALDFESGLEDGSDATTIDNAGTGNVLTQVRATGDASVEVVEGPDGGHAVHFPAYTGAATAPAAVLVAVDDDDDALNPGDGGFSFGASFKLDDKSSGSTADNGDNLIQRGTFDAPGQLKIQVDHGVPSCRVKGDAGEVFVKAENPIDTGAWYRVTCERTGSDLELTVKAYDSGSGGGTWHASGPTGTISVQKYPFTIGGKTAPDGTPVASADQFNGAVDDVFFRVQ